MRLSVHRANVQWAVLVFALVAVFAVAIPACSSYFSTKHYTTVVTRHERVCSGSTDGNSSCKYLVFTEAGTFRISDSLVIGRFNSSDIYGRIKDGHTYKIDTYGWRFGCTSSYQNIKKMEEV